MTQPKTVNLSVLPQAFRDAIRADLTASSQWVTLHDAVTVCARQMRAHGYYPEKVLVAVKSAVGVAATRLLPEQIAEGVVSDAAQACITAYFEPEILAVGRVAGGQPPVVLPTGVETPGSNHLRTLPERFL